MAASRSSHECSPLCLRVAKSRATSLLELASTFGNDSTPLREYRRNGCSHHRLVASQPLCGDASVARLARCWSRVGGYLAARRRARSDQCAGAGADDLAFSGACGGRAVHYLPGGKRHERSAEGGGDQVDQPVRIVGGDCRLRGRHRYLLGPQPDQRTAPAGEGKHSARHGRSADGADRYGYERDLSVRGPCEAGLRVRPDGTADDSRLADCLPVTERAGGDRSQYVWRATEDV